MAGLMRARGAAAVLAALALLTACGSDDVTGDDQATSTPDGERASGPGSGSEPASEPPEPPEPAEPVDLGDAPVVALSGEELCALVPIEAASLALGTEVSLAEATDEATPQCTYTYGADSASLSTFTIAALRAADVGNRGLQEAFDLTLDLNRGIATGSEVEEVEVDAGERAVRLTGESLTLVVVATDGHLLTVVTTPDLDSAGVEALATAAADAVAAG